MDTYGMIGLGFGVLLLVWLVFSIIRKMIGLALLASLAFGAWFVWTNPGLRAQLQAILPFLPG